MRLLNAYLDWFAAGLEKWAADMHEYAKKLPEREYCRGYEDGMRDGRELLEAEIKDQIRGQG